VNLTFHRGIDLESPGGILKGKGKAMRYLTLQDSDDVDRPEIRTYLQLTRKGAGLSRPRQQSAQDVVTQD